MWAGGTESPRLLLGRRRGRRACGIPQARHDIELAQTFPVFFMTRGGAYQRPGLYVPDAGGSPPLLPVPTTETNVSRGRLTDPATAENQHAEELAPEKDRHSDARRPHLYVRFGLTHRHRAGRSIFVPEKQATLSTRNWPQNPGHAQ